MTLSWYRIEPQAPLVFRTAKPFGAGSRDGANFPWPSSLAGLLRTQVMNDRGWKPKLSHDQQAQLRDMPTAGPLLARREGDAMVPWLPKPADALLMLDEASQHKSYRRLQPARLPPACGTDLPDGLLPLELEGAHKGKAQAGHLWWSLPDMMAWGRGESVVATDDEATPWVTEQRTHVAIDRETFGARNGGLFQTDGLALGPRRIETAGRAAGFDAHDWILMGAGPADISSRLVTFGGEGRLSWLTSMNSPALAAPATLASTLRDGFALTLVTPGLFGAGWRPAWLDERLEGNVPGIDGLRIRLRAAAVERWQSISGWDLAAWQAKPARKAVAAGATYWFEIIAGGPEQCAALWLTALSDDAQDRRDGFGLALPRPWNASLVGDC